MVRYRLNMQDVVYRMDMEHVDALTRFDRMLAEAEQDEAKKKETELEKNCRLVENELKEYFRMAGLALDDSVRTTPDARLGGGELPPPDGYRLTEYIRIFLNDMFLHPTNGGGWGIGKSRDAIDLMARIRENPELRGAGSSGDELTPESLKNPDTYPTSLKNYVAMLSSKYLAGMVRIAFEECGLLSYIIYNKKEITDSIINSGLVPDGPEALKEAIPADWDYDKMFHLMHVIIPQFIMKLLVAPATPTPNCDQALIQQNAAYLGNDLRTIQAYVIPIEEEFNVNLQARGSDAPATYNDMARYAAAWNFSVNRIKDRVSHDASGEENVYTPPDDADIPDDLATSAPADDSLNPRYTTEPGSNGAHEYRDSRNNRIREYPSQRFGDWYVVDVDNDTEHMSDNHNILGHGYTVLEDDGGNPYKFWFKGGKSPDDPVNNGVYPWCWTWGHYNTYRNLECGDRGYMLLNQQVLDPDVLALRADDSRNRGNNGNKYDSTAFGIVICGPGNSTLIPGLVKPSCFQARNDTTDTNYLPGAEDASHYDPSIVPNGGNIPGLIPYGSWPSGYSEKKQIAASINNSIFCLALIGKWDGSIKVTNGQDNNPKRIEMYPERLVPLMQKWFPVDLDSTKDRSLLAQDTKIRLYTISDLSTLGRLLGSQTRADDADELDSMVRNLLLTVFKTNDGKIWHIVHVEKSDSRVTGFILAPADDEFKLRSSLSNGNISDSEYDDALGKLPATMFTLADDGRFIPFLAKELSVANARDLLTVWENNKERNIRERIGSGESTVRPDSQVDAGEKQGSIQWAPAMANSGKTRTVGYSDDGEIWIRGPETEGEPKQVASDTSIAELLRNSPSRGTYVVTDSDNYNIWITSFTATGKAMYIAYVRNGKCRLYKMLGSVIGDEEPNAILVNGDKVVLGSLLGDIARLNQQNSDRYSMFVDMSEVGRDGHGPVVDGAGLYVTALHGLGRTYHGCVGLGVSNGRLDFSQGEDTVVGAIDWYTANMLAFVRTTPITLDMIAKTARNLPRELNI